MVQRLKLVITPEATHPVKRERLRLNDNNASTLTISTKEQSVKDSGMTPDELATLAQSMFGNNWKTRLATELDVYVSTVNRWVNGQTPISRRNELALRGLQVEYASRGKVNAA